jgi:peptide-methionine (S)-S-oxide reductase
MRIQLLCATVLMCAGAAFGSDTKSETENAEAPAMGENDNQIATFGGGCFWCVEAIFQLMDGVQSVVSGYEGGAVEDPSYQQVCSGSSGHAEVVQVNYDPSGVSFGALLDAFFSTHDPTTLNRQGGDRGTQYRSVIFYHTEGQKAAAEAKIRDLDASGAFGDPVVTEISPTTTFYPAEKYHQDYYDQNSEERYCQLVVRPKVEKFKKQLEKEQ